MSRTASMRTSSTSGVVGDRLCWDDVMVEGGGSTGRGSPLRRLHERLLSPTQLLTGSTKLRVARATDGSWTITEPGRDTAFRHLGTRGHALAVATSSLAEARGGEIEVTEEDGATHLIPVPKNKRPWWQATRSPLASLLLGLLWLGLFTLRVLDTGWPPGWRYNTFVLVITGIAAALYLSSTVLLIRRRRAPRSSG
jgi:hypothetical protein